MIDRELSFPQRFEENIGRRHCILNREVNDLRAKNFEFLPSHLFELSFGNDVPTLPILTTIECDKNPPPIEPPHSRDRVLRTSTDPKPQNIHRRSQVLHFKTGLLAHDRAPSVGADDQIGAHFNCPVWSLYLDSRHAP